MFKKTVKYTDYNGVERTEDYYFNLSKAEAMEWELSKEGTLSEWMQEVIDSNNIPEIVSLFKEIVLKSYGEKTSDGKRFVKSDEIRTAFEQSPAYSEIFMELAGNADAAAEFVNGILPADIVKDMQKPSENNI